MFISSALTVNCKLWMALALTLNCHAFCGMKQVHHCMDICSLWFNEGHSIFFLLGGSSILDRCQFENKFHLQSCYSYRDLSQFWGSELANGELGVLLHCKGLSLQFLMASPLPSAGIKGI